MSRFNLIEEPWIPVRFLDGRREELGIHDVLLRSKEIAAIEDPSPLVVAALHRFLLAVLYRALEGPTDISQAKEWFRDGMPIDRVEAYLAKWRERFWLFDEMHPFYQVPAYEPQDKKGKKEWKAWPVIAAEHNADNAKVLFDHVAIEAAGRIPSSRAARWLLACQTFSLGGGNSDFGYTKGAPSATAIMALPLGIDLHDTLLLSLVPENREVLVSDLPVWEQAPVSLASLISGVSRPPLGVADLYTWLSRAIKFNLDGIGETVSEMTFAAGVVCSSADCMDPMLGFQIRPKIGKLPIRFSERGLWRDFDSLLPDGSGCAPRGIENAATLTRPYPERSPRSVMVLGLANDQAKIGYWRMERFLLPEALGGDHNIRTEIRQRLDDADEAGAVLEKSLRVEGSLMLARGGRDLLKDKWSAGKWIPGDVSKYIGKVASDANALSSAGYWSAIEPSFHDLLQEYALGRDTEDIQCQWLKSIRDALRMAWEQHRSSVAMGDAWSIRAVVKAERYLSCGLMELDARIARLEPQKESA